MGATSSHRVPRPVVRASACLVAGAVVSQIVGYASAIGWQFHKPLTNNPIGFTWRTVRNTNPTYPIDDYADIATGPGLTIWRVNRSAPVKPTADCASAPDWATPRGTDRYVAYDAYGYGWPFRSLSLAVHPNNSLFVGVEGATPVLLEEATGRRLFFPRRFIWGGLVLNSAFYALPVWLGWVVVVAQVGAARGALAARRLAAQRERCRACGYARAGLSPGAKCPECGSPPQPSGV